MFANLMAKNPIQISGAVMAVLNFAIIMNWVNMTDIQVAAANSALGAVLGLFITSNTVNSKKLEELQ